ncbi:MULTISPECIES: hydroxymethylglutaryl-CoA lyase [Thermomonospora]|uniref:Pyruvate carboxyltransferase n=1 Tax=Thermomonospora curvata (strain ATCC 19995 / DSM 43183 / JCM 3096 / KCTC 9072 / NBRC 15933 / NCIMB 10081 / Henssen B9) TaxID=471852 RepID=D1A7F8_THECD|nr:MULTISPECIES: hydroxymethylglutaryl-CoA lyase [Thermomonospora]ACY96547.1 pyruvate carboxyltransferase [Thermomonospora curvata DSM 43183]PKK15361.1 MAG: hydroxymethylglutaryl-CoA lyase [Thermomonospora sp. CIF 1]
MTAPVRIVEVAPRDGLQNEPTRLTTEQKRRLVEHAVRFGARNIEVTSFVHPAKVPAMADAEDLVAMLPPADGVTYSALILNERGLSRALAAGITEVNVVVHCTDTFSRRNQGTDIAGGIGIWRRIARDAEAAGIRANVTLAVAFGCPFEGEVPVEAVRSVAEQVLQERPPAELSLADTIGVAVPRDVAARVEAVRDLLPEGTALRAHFHNTRNCGIANALAAIDAGVGVLDASLGGIGGCPFAPRATGNIATEDLAYALERSGIDHGLDTAALREAGRWLQEQIGRPLPAMVLHAGGFPTGDAAA